MREAKDGGRECYKLDDERKASPALEPLLLPRLERDRLGALAVPPDVPLVLPALKLVAALALTADRLALALERRRAVLDAVGERVARRRRVLDVLRLRDGQLVVARRDAVRVVVRGEARGVVAAAVAGRRGRAVRVGRRRVRRLLLARVRRERVGVLRRRVELRRVRAEALRLRAGGASAGRPRRASEERERGDARS